jgi:propionyl-CoA synthetase
MRIMNRYRDLYKASLTDPASFWAEGGARGDLDSRAAADSRRHPAAALPLVPDAELNSCANALDRHVDGGRGGQAALIYDSPVTESQRTITYSTPLHVSPAR